MARECRGPFVGLRAFFFAGAQYRRLKGSNGPNVFQEFVGWWFGCFDCWCIVKSIGNIYIYIISVFFWVTILSRAMFPKWPSCSLVRYVEVIYILVLYHYKLLLSNIYNQYPAGRRQFHLLSLVRSFWEKTCSTISRIFKPSLLLVTKLGEKTKFLMRMTI